MSRRSVSRVWTKKDVGSAEQGLQGVILADSYESRLRPATLDTAKTLLPVAGIPLINYSMQLLVNSGVSEILVVTTAHSRQVAAYLRGSKWMDGSSFPCLRVRVLPFDDCTCVGEALRKLEEDQLVKSNPFVLLKGDVVSNVDLRPLIAAHKRRYAKNSDNIMTCVMKRTMADYRAVSLEQDLFVVTSAKCSQPHCGDADYHLDDDCLFLTDSGTDEDGTDTLATTATSDESLEECYELLIYDNSLTRSRVDIPMHVVATGTGVLAWHNLSDSHIDICSPKVLTEFTDNWDYVALRGGGDDDSLSSSLFSQVLLSELFSYKIHCAVVDDSSYAARITDWRTFDGVSRDIVQRYAFPLTLDCNLVGSTFLCAREGGSALHRGLVYKQSEVSVSPKGVALSRGVVLCVGAKIGAHSTVTRSVIGAQCVVAEKCQITNSHLFEKCQLSEGCILNGAVLAAGVRLGKGCIVARGCVLGAGVVLADFVKLDPFTKLTTVLPPMKMDFDYGKLSSAVVESGALAIGSGDTKRRRDSFDSAEISAKSPDSKLDWSLAKSVESEKVSSITALEMLDSSAMKKTAASTVELESGVEYDEGIVGVGGRGFLWRDSEPQHAKDFVPSNVNSIVADERNRPLRGYSMAALFHKMQERKDPSDDESPDKGRRGFGERIVSDDFKGNREIDYEVFESLTDDISAVFQGLDESMNLEENVLPQCRIFMSTTNAGFAEYYGAIFSAMLATVDCASAKRDIRVLKSKLKQLHCFFAPLCERTADESSAFDQLCFLDGMLQACRHRHSQSRCPLIPSLLMLLVMDFGVLSAANVLQWYAEMRDRSSLQMLGEDIRELVVALEELVSDSDSDSDSETESEFEESDIEEDED